MQTIRIIDKLWLRAGMDMRIVTYACVPTSSDKEGIMVRLTGTKSGFIFVRTIYVQNGKCSPFLELDPTL